MYEVRACQTGNHMVNIVLVTLLLICMCFQLGYSQTHTYNLQEHRTLNQPRTRLSKIKQSS